MLNAQCTQEKTQRKIKFKGWSLKNFPAFQCGVVNFSGLNTIGSWFLNPNIATPRIIACDSRLKLGSFSCSNFTNQAPALFMFKLVDQACSCPWPLVTSSRNLHYAPCDSTLAISYYIDGTSMQQINFKLLHNTKLQSCKLQFAPLHIAYPRRKMKIFWIHVWHSLLSHESWPSRLILVVF